MRRAVTCTLGNTRSSARTTLDWQTQRRRWLRVREAAAHLNVSVGALNKLRCTGGGPKFAKLGAVVVYDVDDLDLWAIERKVRSTSEPVVEVQPSAVRLLARGNRNRGADRVGGLTRGGQARVAVRLAVIVRSDDELCTRPPGADRLRHVLQVASIEGDGHAETRAS